MSGFQIPARVGLIFESTRLVMLFEFWPLQSFSQVWKRCARSLNTRIGRGRKNSLKVDAF